jgi:hypothetical protein
MTDSYLSHTVTRVRYNLPACADISGVIQNIESAIINDGTYISELAGAFVNSTGSFNALTANKITSPLIVSGTTVANMLMATGGMVIGFTGSFFYGSSINFTGANAYITNGLVVPHTGTITAIGSLYYDPSGTGTIKVYNGSTWDTFYHS